MSQPQITPEKLPLKIYRHVFKAVGFCQNQLNQSPGIQEICDFVQMQNENLSPVANLETKVTQALDKLTALNVCVRLPEEKFVLFDKNPTKVSRNFIANVQQAQKRIELKEMEKFGLVAGTEGDMNERVDLNEQAGTSSGGNGETVATSSLDEEIHEVELLDNEISGLLTNEDVSKLLEGHESSMYL